MKKLKALVMAWIDGSNRPAGITLYLLQEMARIYNELASKGRSEFIEGDCVKWLKKCGIKISVKGNGWEVKR